MIQQLQLLQHAAIVGTLAVDFSALTSATSISTATSGSVHSSGGSTHSSGGSITVAGYSANSVTFTDATSIKIGDVPVTNITAPDALTIVHGFDGAATAAGTLSSLTVVAGKATSLTASAIKTGAIL